MYSTSSPVTPTKEGILQAFCYLLPRKCLTLAIPPPKGETSMITFRNERKVHQITKTNVGHSPMGGGRNRLVHEFWRV